MPKTGLKKCCLKTGCLSQKRWFLYFATIVVSPGVSVKLPKRRLVDVYEMGVERG